MRSNLDPRRFIWCHYAPHLTDHKRRFSRSHLIGYLIVPVLIGVVVEWRLGVVELNFLPLVIAIYSVLAAVLMGMLPIVYGIVGQVERDRTYTSGQRPVAERELVRLDALQDLYAALTYGMFLLVIALFCAVVLALILPPESSDSGERNILSHALSGVIYFVGASTAISILNVGAGVFDAMEDHTEASKDAIIRNIKSPDDESG